MIDVSSRYFLLTVVLLCAKAYAFSPRLPVRRHDAKAQSTELLHADNSFWDEKFKGDGAPNPSDRMKQKQSDAESIDEQLKELDALAANRPTIRGDYDWDERYKDDPDWITGDVPGKMKMTDEQVEAQQRALDALADKWSDGYETDDAPPEEVNEDT
jgi:hypothetical protein